MNKALFGGALLAAGVTANAQQFLASDTDATGSYSSYAYIFDADSYGYALALAPDDLNIAYAGAYGVGSVTSNADLLRVDVTQDGSPYRAYVGANLQQFFQVDQDADLVLSWNLSNTDGFNDGLLFNDDTGDLLFDLGADEGSDGSAVVALESGVNYALIIRTSEPSFFGGVVPSFTFDGVAFIQAELIPAPASFALLGAAGLAATRRRS